MSPVLRVSCVLVCLAFALPRCQAQSKAEESPAELTRRVNELAALVSRLQARVDELESRLAVTRPADPPAVMPEPAPEPAPGNPLALRSQVRDNPPTLKFQRPEPAGGAS